MYRCPETSRPPVGILMTHATTRPAPTNIRPDRFQTPSIVLAVVSVAQFMMIVDATIVNVALPHIQRALGFSGAGLEWVVNAYALAFGGLLLLLGGRAGDLLGRRKMFITGLLLFSAASLVGGFTGQAFLLSARAVQGVGGALVAPAALSLITTTFPEGPPRTPGVRRVRRDEHRRRVRRERFPRGLQLPDPGSTHEGCGEGWIRRRRQDQGGRRPPPATQLSAPVLADHGQGLRRHTPRAVRHRRGRGGMTHLVVVPATIEQRNV